MDKQHLLAELWVAFEYSYRHDHWVFPLGEILEGIGAEPAAEQPLPGTKSIWEIV